MNAASFDFTLLAAFLAVSFAGLTFVLMMLRRFDRQSDITMSILAKLADRDFHSTYTKEREELERIVAQVNARLTDTRSEFESVNHLVIDGQRSINTLATNRISPESFLESMGISASDDLLEDDLVFVLTPFHPRERATYSAIVEAFDRFPVKVQRGDEQNIETDILSHIVRKIVSARLVIANISSRNPNVMYELGIAHALGKKVIVVSSNTEELPFDFRNRRVLFYKTRQDLVSKLQQEIARKLFDNAL
jgi:nucleoside 2-deoxyribosyltransferase